jgi:hypothetical protein
MYGKGTRIMDYQGGRIAVAAHDDLAEFGFGNQPLKTLDLVGQKVLGASHASVFDIEMIPKQGTRYGHQNHRKQLFQRRINFWPRGISSALLRPVGGMVRGNILSSY